MLPGSTYSLDFFDVLSCIRLYPSDFKDFAIFNYHHTSTHRPHNMSPSGLDLPSALKISKAHETNAKNATRASLQIFAGAPHASTTAAWASNASSHARNLAPELSNTSQSDSGAPDPDNVTPSPRLKELTGTSLDAALADPLALIQDIHTLRIFVALDELPFALLDTLHTQLQNGGCLREAQVCIHSSLRDALVRICGNIGLERGIVGMVRKWDGNGLGLRFFFLCSDDSVELGDGGFVRYCEGNLRMLVGLGKEGTAKVSKTADLKAAGIDTHALGLGVGEERFDEGSRMDVEK
jgi:hypothetical protein